MLAMEDVLCELNEDINEQGLPPGFRFHPTDEELITFYLASKVFNGSFCGVHIAEVDLNRCEPWQLPDVAKMGEREWYFFSLRDRKYPTGLRTNRATGAGYWKATGKDREVHSASTGSLLGMKKTLVFYKGRAPRGEKTKWVMHEYRLDGDLSYRHSCKEEWVICRIFHKIGEKRNNPVFQGQSYYAMEGCNSLSPTRGSLPSLLETAMTTTTVVLESQSHSPIQNPSLIHHHFPESDLKTTNNPIVSQPNYSFPINELQPFFSPTTNSHPSPSIPLESLLSHQVCSFKQQQQQQQQQASTAPKQCKTEANFFPFQPPDANLCWVDRVVSLEPYPNSNNNNTNPLFLGMDCGVVMGFSSAAAPPHTTTVPDRDVHFDGFYY